MQIFDDPIPELKRQVGLEVARAMSGSTVTDLAEFLGLDPPRISNLRRGKLTRFLTRDIDPIRASSASLCADQFRPTSLPPSDATAVSAARGDGLDAPIMLPPNQLSKKGGERVGCGAGQRGNGIVVARRARSPERVSRQSLPFFGNDCARPAAETGTPRLLTVAAPAHGSLTSSRWQIAAVWHLAATRAAPDHMESDLSGVVE